jgi:hypothetical protein
MLFFFLLFLPFALSEGEALVAGGPGLALHFQKDGEHVLFGDFDFGKPTLNEITVEMWLLSTSKHCTFTPFSYSLPGQPQRYRYTFLSHCVSFVWSGLEEVWVLGNRLPLYPPYVIKVTRDVEESTTGSANLSNILILR